jgi:uncharacterized protein (TIGR02246 family)
MKRIFLSISVALGTVLLVLGQTSDVTTIRRTSLEQELIQLKHDIGRAYVKRDAAALERLYADDYTVTDAAGETTSKVQEIERMKTGTAVYEATTYDDVKVRVYGDTAIVAGRGTVKGRGTSGAFHTEYRSTNVFVKRSGRWQVVAAHLSGVKPLKIQ